MTSPAMVLPRPSAWRTWAGVWRLTVRGLWVPRQAIALAVLLAIVAGTTAPACLGGNSDDFREWLTGFYLLFFVPILAFISGGGGLRDDLKSTVTDYIFTRPVSRVAYVSSRYIAQFLVLSCVCAATLGVALLTARLYGLPGLTAHLGRILLVQTLIIAAASGFGFFFAMLTSKFVVLGLVYGAIVEVGIGKIPTQLSHLSFLRHARSLLEPVVDGWAGRSTAGPGEWLAGGALLAFALLTVALTAAVLRFRQFSGERPGDS